MLLTQNNFLLLKLPQNARKNKRNMAVAKPKTKNAVAGNFTLQICASNLFLLLLKSPLFNVENTQAAALLSSSFLLSKIALL